MKPLVNDLRYNNKNKVEVHQVHALEGMIGLLFFYKLLLVSSISREDCSLRLFLMSTILCRMTVGCFPLSVPSSESSELRTASSLLTM